MPDPRVFATTTVTDFDGVPLIIGVDYTTVTLSINGHLLTRLGPFARGQLAAALQDAGAVADTCPDEPDPLDNEPTP